MKKCGVRNGQEAASRGLLAGRIVAIFHEIGQQCVLPCEDVFPWMEALPVREDSIPMFFLQGYFHRGFHEFLS
jgi:hypothetical protein